MPWIRMRECWSTMMATAVRPSGAVFRVRTSGCVLGPRAPDGFDAGRAELAHDAQAATRERRARFFLLLATQAQHEALGRELRQALHRQHDAFGDGLEAAELKV